MPSPRRPVVKNKADVVVKVDPALTRLFHEAMQKFHAASAEGAKSWDQRYEAIAEIINHQPPLYLAGGFATDTDFIDKQIQGSRQAVYRNIRVARFANADDIERYSPARLNLAIAWLETKAACPSEAMCRSTLLGSAFPSRTRARQFPKHSRRSPLPNSVSRWRFSRVVTRSRRKHHHSPAPLARRSRSLE